MDIRSPPKHAGSRELARRRARENEVKKKRAAGEREGSGAVSAGRRQGEHVKRDRTNR